VSKDPVDPDRPGESEPLAARLRQFNYVALVGCVFVLVVAVALINALRSEDSGTLGIGAYGEGEPAPKFAVPFAASDLDGDANVDPEKACEIDEPDALRICDYFDRPLVISFWFTKGASQCIEHQDRFDALLPKYGDRANFVSINVRDDRDRVRELIEEHGWQVPVGHDRDGAVSNVYRVGGCPTFVYVKKGGVVKNAEIGDPAIEGLDSQVRSLLKTDGAKVKPAQAQQ
jgi:peroxiredoxin